QREVQQQRGNRRLQQQKEDAPHCFVDPLSHARRRQLAYGLSGGNSARRATPKKTSLNRCYLCRPKC
ncbi:MAG TPA: hypothetical protein VHM22_14835, partial [Bradyrhizobium sp.]|nr:hypothetical protein [Bradyrhizobium sp.]